MLAKSAESLFLLSQTNSMRILKYLFLLILLALIGVSVYVATQRGDYDVSRSQFIKAPRTVVYQFLSDLSNWEDWPQWENGTRIQLGETTTGVGSQLTWTSGENSGELKTLFLKENDSLAHEFNTAGIPGLGSWKLKDSAGGTVVTWRVKGKLAFSPKVSATLRGGPNHVMGNLFSGSLSKLEKALVYESNTYNIKIDGQFIKPGAIYVGQTIVSTFENQHKNIRVMSRKLDYFFSKNKIAPAGKPFVRYHYFDEKLKRTKFTVCYPVKDTILTSPGSDISFGSFGEYRAVRTTLTGDYTHLKEAWDKTFAYIEEKGFRYSDAGQYLEVFKVSRADEKRPSKWVTEIYVPIQYESVPKPAAPKPVEPAPGDSPTGEIPIP